MKPLRYLVPLCLVIACGDDEPWHEGTWRVTSVNGSALPVTVAGNRYQALTLRNEGSERSIVEQFNDQTCAGSLVATVVGDTVNFIDARGASINACAGITMVRQTDDRATGTWKGQSVELRK